ncbi:hypothetical protein V2G26_013736 [Clonostachys chloroleuca]
MTQQQKDPKTGKLYNRHAGDGSVSPLAFFKSTGWPVYRMLTQFRMANGLFDICHREMYSDIPLEYHTCCNVDLPQHAIGVTLENFGRQRFPELSPPLFPFPFPSPAGQLAPSSSTAEIALNFLVSFVKETKTDPSQIGLISPYKATIDLINRLRKKKPEYLPLASMAPAATVDSYQGRENSIIVAVMCTTAAKGPGFTTNTHRLNVLLSRHKSGIVVFGDINVVEPLVGAKGKGEGGKDKRKAVITRGADNKGKFFQAGKLKNVNANLVKESKVATTVLTCLISKASAKQRAGRAGRTQPGICFRLYTEQTHDTCFTPSAPLQILLLKVMGFQSVRAFDFLDRRGLLTPRSPSPRFLTPDPSFEAKVSLCTKAFPRWDIPIINA